MGKNRKPPISGARRFQPTRPDGIPCRGKEGEAVNNYPDLLGRIARKVANGLTPLPIRRIEGVNPMLRETEPEKYAREITIYNVRLATCIPMSHEIQNINEWESEAVKFCREVNMMIEERNTVKNLPALCYVECELPMPGTGAFGVACGPVRAIVSYGPDFEPKGDMFNGKIVGFSGPKYAFAVVLCHADMF
jgi:hypothetical protein